jgi:hypothetical protein
MNWPRVAILIGETIREMGLLIVVFAPLEAMFAEVSTNLTRGFAVALFGFLLIACGIIVETRQ